MTVPIRFTKMHGLGNDFVVIDAVTQSIQVDNKLARKLAHRYYGIGCDQVLIIEPPRSPDDDFYYRIFNGDGSEAKQCGNGARCIGRFVHEQGLTQKQEIYFGLSQGRMKVCLEQDNQVTAFLGKPRFEPKSIPIKALKAKSEGRFLVKVNNQQKEVTALSLGNPHCVIAVPSIKDGKIPEMAKQLQTNSLFPDGVNVGFMQVLARNHIKLRVFERGAGETMACGTGACAAVVAGVLHQDLGQDVKVDMRGGHVFVSYQQNGEVALTGNCQRIFDGLFELEDKHGKNL